MKSSKAILIGNVSVLKENQAMSEQTVRSILSIADKVGKEEEKKPENPVNPVNTVKRELSVPQTSIKPKKVRLSASMPKLSFMKK